MVYGKHANSDQSTFVEKQLRRKCECTVTKEEGVRLDPDCVHVLRLVSSLTISAVCVCVCVSSVRMDVEKGQTCVMSQSGFECVWKAQIVKRKELSRLSVIRFIPFSRSTSASPPWTQSWSSPSSRIRRENSSLIRLVAAVSFRERIPI